MEKKTVLIPNLFKRKYIHGLEFLQKKRKCINEEEAQDSRDSNMSVLCLPMAYFYLNEDKELLY